MNNIYELFVYVANTNVNFEIIFFDLNEPLKTEVLNFIKFLKTKPSPEQYKNYKISADAFDAYFFFIKSVVDKLK